MIRMSREQRKVADQIKADAEEYIYDANCIFYKAGRIGFSNIKGYIVEMDGAIKIAFTINGKYYCSPSNIENLKKDARFANFI